MRIMWWRRSAWALAVFVVSGACAGAGAGSSGNATLGGAEDETGTGSADAGDASVTSGAATGGLTGTAGSTGVDDTAGGETSAEAMPTPFGLRVDSSGNGVLEPDETVQLEPAWEHAGLFAATIDGTLQSLTGPAGGAYHVVDPMAAYPLPPGGSASCSAGTGDCYGIRVEASTRPSTHWDVTASEVLATADAHDWTVHVGASFVDVLPSSTFYREIETLLHNEMTAGCTATQFCPTDDLPRSQAAVFIARVMAGGIDQVPDSGIVPGLGNYDCAGGNSLFADVAAGSTACPAVHYLAANDVTSGCGANPPTFCPSDPALRRHFAVFLAAALAGGVDAVPTAYVDPTTNLGYDCDPNGADTHFDDAPSGVTWCKHVHYIWARGATDGCGPTTFCPDDVTRRGQAAAFLTAGFGLELY
jgi:hypothetical protein